MSTEGILWLLDTNACITLLRGKDDGLRAKVRQRPIGTMATCVIVRGELGVGARKSDDPRRNQQNVDELLATMRALPMTDECAEEYANIRAHLEGAGTKIGPNDLWIAASALANGAAVVTRNVMEFERVPGLTVVSW